MECCVCNKEIHPYSEEYEPFGCDGEFIHKHCWPAMRKFMARIDNMTNAEFEDWMRGIDD